MVQKEKYEQIINLEKQYETEKKQNEIIRLQASHELMDVQLQKNKQLKILGFVTASLLLFFVLFILVRYFDKIKLNRMLEHKNQKIAQSEKELKVLNAAKNKFFSILAHDLKNPFHTVMGYSYLLSNDYEQFTEKERRKFASDIHHSTNSIFRLLQNLLEWSRSQTGRLIFTPMEIEFKQIFENSVSVLRSLAEQKNIRIESNFDDNLILFADPQMIETVLRNLINNAIKFTPENGLIEITANQVDDQISICVKDSGTGISEEDVQNLFRIDSTVKRKGTNDEDGSGLGLILCKEFVQKNNGTIWVNSSPGNGSSFFFTVPAKGTAFCSNLDQA
jgi:signal transduction histidine kinase